MGQMTNWCPSARSRPTSLPNSVPSWLQNPNSSSSRHARVTVSSVLSMLILMDQLLTRLPCKRELLFWKVSLKRPISSWAWPQWTDVSLSGTLRRVPGIFRPSAASYSCWYQGKHLASCSDSIFVLQRRINLLWRRRRGTPTHVLRWTELK